MNFPDTNSKATAYRKGLNGEVTSRNSQYKELAQKEDSDLNFNWVLAVFRRRLPVMVIVAFSVTTFIGSLIIRESRNIIPIYEGSFRLLVEPVTAESRVAQLSLLSQNPEEIVKQGRFDISLVDYESLIRVLKSPQLIDPILKKIQVQYPNMTYNGLIGKLQTMRVTYEKDAKTEGTSLVRVTYQGSDEEKIKFVLEKVAEGYVDYSIEERKATLKQGIKFIESQLPEQKSRVEGIENRLQDLRQSYGLIDPAAQSEQLSINRRSLEAERLSLEAQIREKEILYNTVQKQFDQANYSFIISNFSNTYFTLLKNSQELETQIATASSRLNEDSIPMQVLREQQQELKQQLRQQAQAVVFQVQNELEALKAKLQALVDADNRLNQQIQIWPIATRQYDELQREREFAVMRYKELLFKLESLQIDEAQIQVPWQIIDPPKVLSDETGKPISIAVKETRKKLAVLVVISTLLSIGVGFLVEVLIPVFHTPEEVKSFTKLKLLGIIPLASSLKKRYKKRSHWDLRRAATSELPERGIQPEYTASFLESFRSLYTNIALIGKNQPIRSLVVSSPSAGDGKSTVAIHLAQTAAAMGQRVLLVDCDLRLPQLHQSLGLKNHQGLNDTVADYLSLNEVIQQSPLEENLFFLSAGQPSPDPIKLLSSQKMQYLMGQLQGFFDLVIYDTPPLVGLADGHLVAARADGVILVVRLAKTERSLIQKALEELQISHALLLGVVANEVRNYSSILAGSTSRVRQPSFSPETQEIKST